MSQQRGKKPSVISSAVTNIAVSQETVSSFRGALKSTPGSGMWTGPALQSDDVHVPVAPSARVNKLADDLESYQLSTAWRQGVTYRSGTNARGYNTSRGFGLGNRPGTIPRIVRFSMSESF